MKFKNTTLLQWTVILVIFLSSISGLLVPTSEAATTTITVTAQKEHNHAYYWCQHLDGHWSTYSSFDGTKTAPNDGGEPKKTWVKTAANVKLPTEWEGSDGKTYDLSQVKNPIPKDAQMSTIMDPEARASVNIENGVLIVQGYSGNGVYRYSGDICGGNPNMIYPFPFSVTFEGTVEVPAPGTHLTRHWTTDGSSLSSVFPDVTREMEIDKEYPTTPPTNSAYEYVGYKFSTSGTAPSGGAVISGSPPTVNYDGSYDTYILYQYYKPVGGEIRIRHMQRTGPTGSFVQQDEQVIAVATLPHSRTVNANTIHGTVLGHNVSYSSYSNTLYSGSSASMSLSASQKTAYVSFFYEKAAPKFTGDFDVLPHTINYRDTFKFKPKNFVMNGCTYQSHWYKIERNGTYTSPAVTGQTTETSYTYGSYPWNIGVGTHTISMKIKSSCGESEWIGPKTLTVNSAADNNPPQFKVGFVKPSEPTVPLTEVVEGTVLNLIYINDPSIPTPTDPDGDDLYFMGFDTAGSSSSFIQSIPSKSTGYGDGYHNITMDTAGYHPVSGQMRDQWGLTASASTMIKVIPKNPVAVPACPAEVKENRPVPLSDFNADRSYSPIGRSIDHSRDEWTNRQTQYTNGTSGNITAQVSLHVYDSAGLKSLEPGLCTIIVKPDLPPVAKLDVPPLAIRGQSYDLYNRSTSPDGDTIQTVEYKYKYDRNNNGFEDDSWVSLSGSLMKAVFKPEKVGKYLFYLKATEDYGKFSDTNGQDAATLTMDVLNQAPEVSFAMSGENQQPDLTTPIRYNASTILSNWDLFQVNSSAKINNPSTAWSNENGVLAGGLGRGFEKQLYYSEEYTRSNYNYYKHWFFPFQDYGFGQNNLNAYRTIKQNDAKKSQPFLISLPHINGGKLFPLYYYPMNYGAHFSYPITIRSNPSHIYFNWQEIMSIDDYYYNSNATGQYFFAMNKNKIGGYEGTTFCPEPCYGYNIGWEHKWLDGSPYDFILSPVELVKDPDRPTFSRYRYWDSRASAEKDTTRATYMDEQIYEKVNVLGYEVADRTIYQYLLWSCKYNCSYYYNDDGDIKKTTDQLYEIRTYEAFTGELIGKSSSHTTELGMGRVDLSSSYSKGDNLVIFTGGYWYNPRWSVVYEVNRQAQIVKKTEIEKPQSYTKSVGSTTYTCDYQHQHRTKGTDGEWYGIEQAVCRNGDTWINDGVYAYKLNPDLTFAWRKKLQGQNATFAGSLSYNMGDPTDAKVVLIVNSIKKEILVRSYTPSGFNLASFYEVIRTDTGQIRTLEADYNWTSQTTNFVIAWNGNYVKRDSSVPSAYTEDGYATYPQRNENGSYSTVVKDGNGNEVTSWISGGILNLNWMSADTATTPQLGGFYVGDGMYLSFLTTMSGGNDARKFTPWLNVGTPSDQAKPFAGRQLGQFVSDVAVENTSLTFSLKMLKPNIDSELTGFSFRMSDPQNRYAIETNGSALSLSKYVNGTRTVLESIAYPFAPNVNYSFEVKILGDKINVNMDGVPYFENVSDASFASGKIGMFSIKPYVSFSGVTTKELQEQPAQWSDHYAIWEDGTGTANVKYEELAFSDPENDPMSGTLKWHFTHIPKFINNQGISLMNGQTFSSEQLVFDNVGEYTVTLSAEDDPHPDYRYPSNEFSGYRKPSNSFQQRITVHRRPIAYFEVVQNTDGKVKWTDYSHDPDRYETTTNYSDEDTGIDYKLTKGVLQKKFYYVTPSGRYDESKLVSPEETGTYEIAMAVMDEYGAWSDYFVENLDIDSLPVPNQPPAAGFTTSHTNTFRGVAITINSTASDPEDGGRENLNHAYYIQNISTGGNESLQSFSRTSWIKSFNSLGTFNIRQVVEDSEGATALFERRITISNRKPAANTTVPAGENQNNPTKLTVLRPEFQWTFNDADGDAQTRYQIRIYRYGGIMELDSGVQFGNELAWVPASDLPEKVNLYIQVKVHDEFEWGDWSPAKYFYIETNRPPQADFEWTPQPAYEGDDLGFINKASDPDGESLTSRWSIVFPDLSSLQNTQHEPMINNAAPGIYTVRLTVSDGKESRSASKTIQVLPLTLQAAVNHTEKWRSIHEEAAHETQNPPKDFYAGETFVLEADVSETPVLMVTAYLEATGLNGQTLYTEVQLTESPSQPNRYEAEFYDSRWGSLSEGLPKGLHNIQFKAEYRNGTVKTAIEPIRILGNAQESIRIHRRR